MDVNYIVIDPQPINWVYPPASGIIWRPVVDASGYQPGLAAGVDWDKLAKESWILYSAHQRMGPPTKSRPDRLRWWLRCKLIEWRVI